MRRLGNNVRTALGYEFHLFFFFYNHVCQVGSTVRDISVSLFLFLLLIDIWDMRNSRHIEILGFVDTLEYLTVYRSSIVSLQRAISIRTKLSGFKYIYS